MDSVNLINVNNETISVNVIRYFQLNNSNYLIYSLNEIDAQNYVKLYAVKIENSGGVLVSSNIVDENIWTSIKEQIKIIVRGNKDGVAQVDDLNYRELETMKINEGRVFKLSNQLVSLLGANKKVFEEEETAETLVEEQPKVEMEPVILGETISPSVDIPTPGVSLETQEPSVGTPPEIFQATAEATNYQELYKQEQDKNILLQNKLDEIKRILE